MRSPVRLGTKNGAVRRRIQRRARKCASETDWVAERAGFEPSLWRQNLPPDKAEAAIQQLNDARDGGQLIAGLANASPADVPSDAALRQEYADHVAAFNKREGVGGSRKRVSGRSRRHAAPSQPCVEGVQRHCRSDIAFGPLRRVGVDGTSWRCA
jgi:hypothetical protein